MVLGIVRKNEQEFAEFISQEWGFLAGLVTYNEEPIKLEGYQYSFLKNKNRFRWVTKARQIGFSFLFALEALARCHLRRNHAAYFISYNLDEAKSKIQTARQLYESLPLSYQKPIDNDAKTELSFQSNSAKSGQSVIASLPSREPRGKHGDIYLDELAHYTND